ncbi:MAG: DNA recombination protein RmuC [Bacteroidales bacterium]|nr:DNA recombination protein RmuC [Bacteroidales bacterium]
MEFVFGIIGLVVGLVIGILVARAQKSALEVKANAVSDEAARLKEEIASQKSEMNALVAEKQELATKCEVLATQKDNVEAKAREEAEKHIQEKAAQQEAFAQQMASVKEDNEQKCKDQEERHAKEIAMLNDSHQRELQSKTAEHEKTISAIKEHHEKEVNTLKASFDESRENWMSERRTIDSNNQKLLQAKETEHKAVMAAQEKRHDEAVKSMKQTFAETIDHLKANLKAATEDMLKMRQAEFTDINKQNMQSIVDPLNETIAKMKQAMDGYSKEQNEFSGSMKTSIQAIIQQTETARQSAIELTTALKHDTKMQGDYGEAILDEILSKQGFTEGIHYELQYVMKDEAGRELKGDDGKGLRPDVLFHIDTVRDVIIDSKVNLTDFINFANAETPDERKMHLERHVKSIESQVKLLSQKNYFKYHKKTNTRMDYVIMFVPISAAWWEALRYKPSLWREAMDSNVYIADEQTLFAALRIIKLTWTQIAQVKSQKEIFDLVNQMIDRVGQFMKSYKAIGEAIGKAQDAYDKGYEKLTPGGQSILTTTTNLLKLGGRDSKTNPVAKFIDVDEIPALPEPEG